MPRRRGTAPFAQLREFAEFWKYDAQALTCCLTATEEELEEDPEAYLGCEDCPVAQQIDGLDAQNHDAYRLYQQVVTRFAVEAHAIPLALSRITEDLSQDEFTDLWERFGVLHDVFCPPPERGSES